MTGTKPVPLSNNRGRVAAALVVLTIISLLAAVAIGALLGKYVAERGLGLSVREVWQRPFGGKRVIRVLVLGEDNTGVKYKDARGLSDTIILASINLQTKHVAAISIPRDTKVDLDGYRDVRKINAAHVHGGPALAALGVEALLGVESDYYVKANIEGFVGMVDALGGVEIDVEKRMYYRDRRGGLLINLKKGRQLLDGDKAMQYVRFRHDAMGDITRIQRQQKFIKALAKKTLSPANLPKLPQIVDAVVENVETDMNPKDILYLAKFASQVDFSQVEMATLPGGPQSIDGISYWIPDGQQVAEVVRELFFPETVIKLPSVQVLNGSGMQGAAVRVAEILKQHGYEITTVGNADAFDYVVSEVINHNGTDEGASRIAALLNSRIVRRDQDASAPADVTVIVGKDYSLAGPGS